MGVNLTFTVREKRKLDIQKIVSDMGKKNVTDRLKQTHKYEVYDVFFTSFF